MLIIGVGGWITKLQDFNGLTGIELHIGPAIDLAIKCLRGVIRRILWQFPAKKSYSIQLGTFLFSHIWNCKNQVYTNLRGEKVLLESWKNKIALNMAHNDWLRDNISTSHGATLQFSFLLCLLQISQKLLPFPLQLLSNNSFGIQLDRRFKKLFFEIDITSLHLVVLWKKYTIWWIVGISFQKQISMWVNVPCKIIKMTYAAVNPYRSFKCSLKTRRRWQPWAATMASWRGRRSSGSLSKTDFSSSSRSSS